MIAKKKLIIVVVALCAPVLLYGQGRATPSSERITSARFIGIPIINYNRNVEFILGAFGGFYHPVDADDSISPPSFTGLGGIYTTNGTGSAIAFSQLYMFEDHLRIKVAGGVGKINFQYFNDELGFGGGFVNYTSTAGFFVVSPLFRIAESWYLGPEYSTLNVATQFEGVQAPEGRRTYSSLGVSGEYDTRPSKTYPLQGTYCVLRVRRYADWLGSASEYTKVKLELNSYTPLQQGSVLALRASIQAALGVVPFEAQTVVGAGKDIRGYSEGKYRGDQVYAIQGEYRWNFAPPFGAVGFLGFALPVTKGEQVAFGDILPGLGAGFRYTMIPDLHANVGVDVAVGRDDWGLYFRIAEAF